MLTYLLLVASLFLNAQSDYYSRQALNYLRETKRYENQVRCYENNENYYQRQLQSKLRDAEYYSRLKNYSMVSTSLTNARNSNSHASD